MLFEVHDPHETLIVRAESFQDVRTYFSRKQSSVKLLEPDDKRTPTFEMRWVGSDFNVGSPEYPRRQECRRWQTLYEWSEWKPLEAMESV